MNDKKLGMRILRLFFGIFLYALGIVLSIRADIGVAPWATFHQGISNLLGITFGQATIGVGFIILGFNYFMDIKIGFGTIINVFGIGSLVDFLLVNNIVPKMTTLLGGIVMVILSMFVIALATYFYIGAGFGTGPRDGLMVGLVKKTNKKVGLIRGSIELTVLFIGFMLGAKVGIGTVILGVGIGPIVHWTFKVLDFDVKNVEHQYLSLKFQL
ncbi:YczE/YyaS/YitT family protein [Fusibacter ferrireducens]|uniref:YitT family protein n=1 Tax=Fusibacter ferrireducens TaxID=2785058 RepID=A0ABR9ZNA9_9FIRM|nr:hypothetical protein [Fusibacter ferrireducens]MBF4691919.1 hypothetical protein [Fusibacter ferrireducens]